MRITRRNTPALYSCSCSSPANNALRLNKCMRESTEELISIKRVPTWRKERRENGGEREKRERAISDRIATLVSFSLSVAFSPGSKAPFRKLAKNQTESPTLNGERWCRSWPTFGIQQICSLTFGIGAVNRFTEKRERTKTLTMRHTGQKNTSNYLLIASFSIKEKKELLLAIWWPEKKENLYIYECLATIIFDKLLIETKVTNGLLHFFARIRKLQKSFHKFRRKTIRE